MKAEITIRKGTEADLPTAIDLIIALAEHEQSRHEMLIGPEQLLRDGSGEKPLFEFLVAESAGELVGLAVYFDTYSTWKGKLLYLEDLVVKQDWRGQGIGRKLMDSIQQEARNRKANYVFWQAHDYNEAALGFYKSLGATLNSTWVTCSLKV